MGTRRPDLQTDRQLYDKKVSIPVNLKRLSIGYKSSAFRYLMFLKQNREGTVKGRGCANKSKQQVNK